MKITRNQVNYCNNTGSQRWYFTSGGKLRSDGSAYCMSFDETAGTVELEGCNATSYELRWNFHGPIKVNGECLFQNASAFYHAACGSNPHKFDFFF